MRKLKFIVGGFVALVVLGVVALVAITLIRDDDPDLKTEAPSIPVAADVGTTPSASTPAASATTTAGVLRFVVDQSGSEVKYVVREKLARLPVSSDAVGTTKMITGEISLTPQGLASGAQSKFSVDLRTLRTDESLRDRYVRTACCRRAVFPPPTSSSSRSPASRRAMSRARKSR